MPVTWPFLVTGAPTSAVPGKPVQCARGRPGGLAAHLPVPVVSLEPLPLPLRAEGFVRRDMTSASAASAVGRGPGSQPVAFGVAAAPGRGPGG